MKLFLTADNHLGKNLKKKKALRELAIENFKDIANKAKGCDYAIFAGDVFDKENTDIQCYTTYAETLKELTTIDTIKKILIITGNHDQFNDYYNNASIDIIKVLKSDKIVVCNIEHMCYYNSDDDVLFLLLPYHKELFLINEFGRRAIIDKINEIISELFNKPEYANSYKVLVSHFPIKEWMPFSDEALNKEELKAGNHFNLVLLGDLHNETFEDLDPGTSILYAGSTMQTSISDLYNHDNVAKIITVDDHTITSVDRVKFNKPKIILVNEDNIEQKRPEINENVIVITSDLKIHMALKERVMYSLYKPIVSKETTALNTFNETVEIEHLDINKLAKDKIDEDTSIDEETKIYLKKLIDIDTDSLESAEIAEEVKKLTMEGIA